MARKQLSGLRVEALGEVVEQFDTAPNCSGARGAGLDHHGAGGVWLVAGEPEQGLEPGANPVAPDVAAVAGGGADRLPQPLVSKAARKQSSLLEKCS